MKRMSLGFFYRILGKIKYIEEFICVQVCFQTPRRDPLTKRILSPTKTAKMTSVDECIKGMESLNLDKPK